jgi:signal transduction histidine kinase
MSGEGYVPLIQRAAAHIPVAGNSLCSTHPASRLAANDDRAKSMLHEFLYENRTELIARCRAKVALRPAPRPTPREMEHGIPLFLGLIIETLRIEQGHDVSQNPAIPGSSQPERHVPSELASAATKHGHELLRQGFTVDQVVHDYGDLCQAITELAIEKKAPVSAEEFHTLNRCLDDAIADAVTEFGWQRDQLISEMGNKAMSERLGFLAHELRNFLNTAILSFAAIKTGSVGLNGPTSGVMDRSLVGLRDLIDRALADVRLAAGAPSQFDYVEMDRFIAEVQVAASLEAKDKGCKFTVFPVEPGLAVQIDRPMLYSAVSNLLQNAFKFTRWHSHVSLKAYASGDRVLIKVEDQCGGLPAGKAEAMFQAFEQHHADRSGLGLGLSVARRAVETSGGKLTVRDIPGIGCVFTIDLPREDDRRTETVEAGDTTPSHVSHAAQAGVMAGQ